MRKKVALLFLGCILVLFGVLWGGDSVGIWDFELFFDGWWSLIFIIMPIYGMIRHGVKWFDIVIMAFGFVVLFSHIGLIDWEKIRLLFWPALVIFIGLYVIYSVFKKKPSPRLEKEAYTHINSTFESCKRNCDGQVYEGGKVSALFGGAELDLRNAVIEHEIYIQATSVFGGVKIWFPPNVRVVAEDASFLGGVKVYTKENPAVNAPVVHIRCSAIFGGVELY